MGLGEIFGKIKDAITGGNDEQQTADTTADPAYDNEQGIQDASQDAYGDPADSGTLAGQNDGDILDASQDPYGDPADQGDDGSGIQPASQDPYGDPADQR